MSIPTLWHDTDVVKIMISLVENIFECLHCIHCTQSVTVFHFESFLIPFLSNANRAKVEGGEG